MKFKMVKFLLLSFVFFIFCTSHAQTVWRADGWFENYTQQSTFSVDELDPDVILKILDVYEKYSIADAEIFFPDSGGILPIRIVSIAEHSPGQYTFTYRPAKTSVSDISKNNNGGFSFEAKPYQPGGKGITDSDQGGARPGNSEGSGGSGASNDTSKPIEGGSSESKPGSQGGSHFGSDWGESLQAAGAKVGIGLLYDGLYGNDIKKIYDAINDIEKQINIDLKEIEKMRVELEGSSINLSLNLTSRNGGIFEFPKLDASRIKLVGLNVNFIDKDNPFSARGPIQPFSFKTSALSQQGQLLNKIAKSYNVEWVRRSGFTDAPTHEVAAYFSGAALLQSADTQFFLGDTIAGTNSANASKFLLQIAQGLAEGFLKDGALALVESLPTLAMTSAELLANLERAKYDPLFAVNYYPKLANQIFTAIPEIAHQIKADFIRDYNTIKQGSAYERARLAGRVSFEAITDFFTSGTSRTARTGGVIASRATQKSIRQSTKRILEKTIGNSDYSHLIRGKALYESLNQPELLQKATRFSDIENVLAKKGITTTPKSKDYLANLIANEGKFELPVFSDSKLIELTDSYVVLESKFANLKTSGFKGQVHRAIPKQVMVDNKLIELSPADIFKLHGGSIYSNGRASGVGKEALYTVIGKDYKDIREVIMAEIGATDMSKYWKGSTFVESDKILDLSVNSKIGKFNLEQLGLKQEYLLHADDMLLPQALSHIADEFDFEAIILPSRHNTNVSNLNIFY